MIKVSVIMPVYNSKEYMEEAINSILIQSMKEFELILVDDGSTDGSSEVCDAFAEKDARVNVIHKKNGGICSARNAGLAVATGEYIGFCDNDDLYEIDLLRDNYEKAKKIDADVVRYKRRLRLIYLDGTIKDIQPANFEERYIKPENLAVYYEEIRRSLGAVWTGLYKRSFLKKNNIKFDESMKFGAEDLFFNLNVLSNSPSVVLNPQIYYNWIKRQTHSTSAKFDENWLCSMTKCVNKECENIKKLGIEKAVPGTRECILSRTYLYEIILYLQGPACKLSMQQKIEKLKNLRNQNFFQRKVMHDSYKNLFKLSKKDYVIVKLFDMRLYRILYYLIGGRNGK